MGIGADLVSITNNDENNFVISQVSRHCFSILLSCPRRPGFPNSIGKGFYTVILQYDRCHSVPSFISRNFMEYLQFTRTI